MINVYSKLSEVYHNLKIGREFVDKTKYSYLGKSDQSLGQPQPPAELAYDQDALIIELPLPQDYNVHTADLTTAIQHRKSIRKYSTVPLALDELSHLLWCTQGVKEVVSGRTMRTVPSAGSRHALETWLVVNNVIGVQPGLYRFVATKHQLSLIAHAVDGDIITEATKCCMDQAFVKSAAALFIWVATPYRMTWRYSDRGYRYLYLDLYLAAESINAGVCAVAAYDDDRMNTFLGLDGENAFAIYMATVGHRL